MNRRNFLQMAVPAISTAGILPAAYADAEQRSEERREIPSKMVEDLMKHIADASADDYRLLWLLEWDLSVLSNILQHPCTFIREQPLRIERYQHWTIHRGLWLRTPAWVMWPHTIKCEQDRSCWVELSVTSLKAKENLRNMRKCLLGYYIGNAKLGQWEEPSFADIYVDFFTGKK